MLLYLWEKTYNFAVEFKFFYMRNIISYLITILFFSSVSLHAQVYEEVDSAYLAEIEQMVAEAEIKTAVNSVNNQYLIEEMKFDYGNLIPLAQGFISVYARRDFIQNHPAVFEKKNWNAKDYIVAGSPLAAAWIMKAAGVESRSTTRRMLTANAFGLALAAGLTEGTKHIVSEQRPDLSDDHSFPSGHTTLAYVGATVLSREFGHHSPWISVGAYTAATATGLLRINHNSHWLSDIYMGAAIGTVSANFGYWLADRIYGVEGINRPQMTLDDVKRTLKMAGTPSSFAFVAASDLGKNTIDAKNLLFSDAMNPIRDDGMHVHLSTFMTAGVEASWFVNPYLAIEAIAQNSVGQAKVYTSTSNVFTGNALQLYRGSLAVKGSVPLPGTATRLGIRALTGIRSLDKADFYLTDAQSYSPQYDYSITLPRDTKFELGCGFNYDILDTKSYVLGFNFDYYHAFSKITPNRFLISTVYRVLF